MHIKLAKALKASNVPDDLATEGVEANEEHIAVMVQVANKTLELQSAARTWVIASVGFVTTVIGPASTFMKAFAH